MSLICYQTKIHFADDVLDAAMRAEMEMLRLRRPLIVTDRDCVETGLLERAIDALPDRCAPEIYDAAPESPTEAAAREAAELFRERRCDSLIGLGAGASVDLAKASRLLAYRPAPLEACLCATGAPTPRPPPLIAIPTTAGSGAEVWGGVVIELTDQRRVRLLSPDLLPTVAICDPTLTVGLAPERTAGVGMDALSHCIETFVATAYNPPADGIALDGLRRGAANIRRAVDKGRDLDARREMMATAMNGALAMQKGLGGVHAMSHALGALRPALRLAHGAVNAVLLPHVLEFNAPAVGHRYRALKQAMALPARADLPSEMAKLNQRLGLPTRLGEMGVDAAEIDRAAPLAEADHANGANPRRADAESYRALMQAAL